MSVGERTSSVNMLLIVTIVFYVFLHAYPPVSGQDMAGSAGQMAGGLTSALSAMLNNASTVERIVAMFQNPGDLFSQNSALTAQLLQRLQSQNGTVGLECIRHLGMLGQALTRREDWALRMVDAMAKPPSGILTAKDHWIGDWDECVQTEATVYRNFTLKTRPTHPFTGKYCNIYFPIKGMGMFGQPATVAIDTCLPSSCTSADATTLIRTLVGLIPKDTFNVSISDPSANCQETSLQLDGQAIAVIAVCSIFGVIMTLATVYDVVYVHWLAKKNTSVKQSDQNGIVLEEKIKAPEVYVVENGPTANKDVESNEQANNKPQLESNHTRSSNTSQYKPSSLEGVLLSFSMFTNGTKILNTNQPSGALTAVNGIRFISMTWVIVGHSVMMLGYMQDTANKLQYSFDLMKRPEFIPILNGTFSVDTFFVLSGLLVSYLTMKELTKVKGVKQFRWGMYYFHRIWRLTPPYMLLLMMWVSLDKYIANGPLWSQQGIDRNQCHKTWWTNLLYINNLVNEKGMDCFGWSWYLANDMQFYIIGPLVLIPLYLSPVFGSLCCLALLLVSTISSGVISWKYKMLPPTDFQAQVANNGWDYYVKPWCRVGPYAIGIFTGYLLHRYQLKIKIHRYVNLFLWAVSITVGCLIVYGLYSDDLTTKLTLKESTLYNATARSAWGACVAWVIFACANGYGGPVNHILSWPGFVPLGRLTYFAYLVHPILQIIYHSSQRSAHMAYDYSVVYMVLGDLCMSYAAAFVLSLAFEAPMMGLEKALLGRKKNS